MDCPDSVLGAIAKRIGCVTPAVDHTLLKELREFTLQWVVENLEPLPPDSDLSVETWLSNTRYTQKRKTELYDLYRSEPVLLDKHLKVKGFIKDETYSEYKYPRGIHSRHDRFKCEFGPVSKLIEERMYKTKWFIKHVPVADRPKTIRDRLDGFLEYIATDYSTFEALFTKDIMMAVEYVMFSYMVQHLPNRNTLLELFHKALAGVNEIDYKFWSVSLEAVRMSGEMTTSLFNGFANLMFMLFVASKTQAVVDGFVEGDDGIFAVQQGSIDETMFARLGLIIKLERHIHLSEASFCGIVFDCQDCINITDPREVLASFGWTTNTYYRANSRVRKMLLRAKALSYAHQYPGCPIISSLAKYGLRMTRSYDIRHFVSERMKVANWDREQILDALQSKIPDVAVGFRSRLLVERLYGIPVEKQLKIEMYLDSLQEIVPLNIPNIDVMVPQDWADYFIKYSTDHADQQLLLPNY